MTLDAREHGGTLEEDDKPTSQLPPLNATSAQRTSLTVTVSDAVSVTVSDAVTVTVTVTVAAAATTTVPVTVPARTAAGR